MEKERLAKAVRVSNVFLAGSGIISIVVLLNFLVRYAWIHDRQFLSFTAPIMYYGLPAITALLLFASLRLKPNHKVTISLVCLSLTASTCGSEIFLSVRKIQEAQRSDKAFTQMIADLNKKGIEPVPGVILPVVESRTDAGIQPAIDVHGVPILPLSGVARRITAVCHNEDQALIYESDEHGFHNPTGIWHSSQVDVAAVGNSWTQGWCVPTNKNFAALIRRKYPSMLNLGMAGEGPLAILGVVKEYLVQVRPRIVLWFYYEGNSLDELAVESQSSILMRYLKPGFTQHLVENRPEIDRALLDLFETTRMTANHLKRPSNKISALGALLKTMKLGILRTNLGLLSEVAVSEPRAATVSEHQSLNLFIEILWRVRDSVTAWGGNLYFVYLPAGERYAHSNLGLAAEQRDQILSSLKKLNVPLIDLNSSFQIQNDPLSLFPSGKPGHYAEKGHRLVAEEVLRKLRPQR